MIGEWEQTADGWRRPRSLPSTAIIGGVLVDIPKRVHPAAKVLCLPSGKWDWKVYNSSGQLQGQGEESTPREAKEAADTSLVTLEE